MSGARKRAPDAGARVTSLDWLRVLALAGVFVFHTLRPFDTDYWHVKSDQRSEVLTVVLVWLATWGLAFFFLVSGAGAHLALRHRSAGRFAHERMLRLAVPLAVGWLLLGPPQLWLEVHHHEISAASFVEMTERFLRDPLTAPPLLLNHTYALWFLVFLLEFSLIGLPLFGWLRRPAGRRALIGLGRLGDRRGGVLLLFVPVAVITLPLAGQAFGDHNWSQWVYFFAFFVLGHVVAASPSLLAAVRRDALPALVLGVAGLAGALALDAPSVLADWDGSWSLRPVLIFVLIAAQAWGWVLAVWGGGMRLPAFRRPLPRVLGDAAMPFFVLHQPVILAVAYVAVGRGLGIPATWLLIAVPSLGVTAALAVAAGRTPGVRRLLGVTRRTRRRPGVVLPAGRRG